MSIYTTAIKYDPSWEVPSLEDIDAVAVSSAFCKKLAEFHTGLRYVNVTPTYRDPDSGGNMRCSPQKFSIKGAGKNKIPAISVDELARIITCFAQEQCNDLDRGEVCYECHFKGNSDEHGGEFYNRGSFRLQPEPEEEPKKKPSPSNGEGSTLVVSGGRGLQGPPRRFLGDPGSPAPTPMESEAVAVIRIAVDAQKSQLNDAQAMLEQFKDTVNGIMQSVSESWHNVVTTQNTVIDKLMEENEHQRKEISNANNRLIKMSEQYASQTDGEKKILQYAMNMFLEGMKTQWGAMSREMSWERQIMYQQFDALAQQYKKDNRSEWLKDYSPLLLAVAGQALESFGSKGQGQFLQQIAAGIAQEEEDEDDANSVQVEARPARPAPPRKPIAKNNTVMGVPPGADPGKHLEQNPVASIFQLFGTTVKDNEEQVEKIRKILGDKFEMFHQATSANDDAQARAYGVRFMTSLTQNGLRTKLESVLNDEQRELLGDIHKQLFGSVAKPPLPSDGASVAELRTFAKQNYGLTFPRETKKEDMLNAIKERATN